MPTAPPAALPTPPLPDDDVADAVSVTVEAAAETGSEVTNTWNGVVLVNSPAGGDGVGMETVAAGASFETSRNAAPGIVSGTFGRSLADSSTSPIDGTVKDDCGGGGRGADAGAARLQSAGTWAGNV